MSYYCIQCKNNISQKEYQYSFKNFRKALCRLHQPTIEAKRFGKKLEEFGWKIDYEKFDGFKNIDISIEDAKVDIEIDGLQHSLTKEQALSDLKRTFFSYKKDGYITLRIPNILIRDEKTIEEAAIYVGKFLEENERDIRDNFLVRFFKKIKKYV